jgi:uncharacterized SAM-binding protein YcdF (DUF218 family)
MPLSFGLIVFFIGLIFLYKNNIKKAKYFLTFSFVWIAIISYAPFSNMVIKPLETTYNTLETPPKDTKYILLLGGDFENRAWELLRLHHLLPNAKIITSGYKSKYNIPEATRSANILKSIGIDPSLIVIHNKPKDTYEEGLEMKKLLNDQKFILITSAYHISRAIKLFENMGLHPIAAPTDIKSNKNDKIYNIPQGTYLVRTELALHEYIGQLWSKLRGQL